MKQDVGMSFSEYAVNTRTKNQKLKAEAIETKDDKDASAVAKAVEEDIVQLREVGPPAPAIYVGTAESLRQVEVGKANRFEGLGDGDGGRLPCARQAVQAGELLNCQ